MKKIFKAKIEWFSKDEGGRQSELPHGDRYAPVVKVINSKKTSVHPWSLIVSNKEKLGEFVTIADMWYIYRNTPNNLARNDEFELYEGSKLVAKGTILEEC